MSYTVMFCDAHGNVVNVQGVHGVRGATYAVGGSSSLELDITYNYHPLFSDLWKENGIHSIEGVTAEVAASILFTAIRSRPYEDAAEDYWALTWGNVRRALIDLLHLACLAPPDAIVRIS